MAVVNLAKSWKLQRFEPDSKAPDQAEAIYWHKDGAEKHCSALGLKCRKSGSRTWVWDFRMERGGSKFRMTYGSPDAGIDFDAAKRLMLMDRARVLEGVNPAKERDAAKDAPADAPDGKTVADLVDTYLARLPYAKSRKGKPLSTGYIAKVKRRLEPVKKLWGARPAASITRHDVSTFLDGYDDRPAAQELMQAHIGAVFNFAVDRGTLRLDQHASKGMKQRGGAKQRVRFLNEAELRLALPELRAIGYPGGHAMQLMLLTGRRPNEVLRAEWSEFDLEEKTWRLPGDPSERAFPSRRDGNGTAKNRVAHTLPLSPMAIEVLGEVAKHRVGDMGRFLFHAAGSDRKPTDNIRVPQTRTQKAMAEATAKRKEPEQRDPFHLHDLRRTAASMLEILEAPDAVVKTVLNHSDSRGVTALYMRMMADEELRLRMLRKWLDVLSAHYTELAKAPLALPAPTHALPSPENDKVARQTYVGAP